MNEINETIERVKYRVSDVIDLVNRQKETIGRYESLLKKDMSSIYTYYAVFKSNKFMMKYENGKAYWCIIPSEANLFRDKEMAKNFAKITNGKVVNITIGVSK